MIILARRDIESVGKFSYATSSGCAFGGRCGCSTDIPAVMPFAVLSPPNPDPTEVCGDGWTHGRGFQVWVLV